MTMTERSTVVGVFTERTQAERAIEELYRVGFSSDQVGFVARNAGTAMDATPNGETRSDSATGAAAGAVGGGVVGGVLGAAAALLIPGFGPAIAGGILTATLGGAALGAVAGGFAGALTGMGIPEEEANYYQGELETGRTIVTVKAPGRYEEALSILRRNGAYDAAMRPAMNSTQTPGMYEGTDAGTYNAGLANQPGTYVPNQTVQPGVDDYTPTQPVRSGNYTSNETKREYERERRSEGYNPNIPPSTNS